jgi:hypothetical protein
MFHKMGRLAITLKCFAMRPLLRSGTFVAVDIKTPVTTYLTYGEKLEIQTKFQLKT